MKKTILILFFFISASSKGQLQHIYLGMNQKQLVENLSGDNTVEFVQKDVKDSTTCLEYKTNDPNTGNRYYYLNKEDLCILVRCIYLNKFLSYMYKEINSSKNYSAIDNYKWKSKDGSHIVNIKLYDKEPAFDIWFSRF